MTAITEKAIEEWPATLAVLTLILGHVYLTVIAGEELTPLGAPLFVALLVFLSGELVRRLR